MVHAEHKAERLATNARLKAKLQAKAAGQSTPLDTTANTRQKVALRLFWATNAEQFKVWWRAQAEDGEVVRTLAGSRTGPPNQQIQSSSAELTAAHQQLLPELSPHWLCLQESGSGLAWLMQTRASALQGSVHTDDAADIEMVKRLQRSGRESPESPFACFPGLSREQSDDGFCGLGNEFGLSGAQQPLARGEEVLALGAPRMELLTADMRGLVARTEVFRWAVYRQECLLALLLDAAKAFEAARDSVGASPSAGGSTSDPAADAALQQTLEAGDLQALREALELHAGSADPAVVQAARAERDRLAKRAKKDRAKVKKAGGMHTMECAVMMSESAPGSDSVHAQ
jgi:hypothetical protein